MEKSRYQSPVRRFSADLQKDKEGSPELKKLKSLLKGRAGTAAGRGRPPTGPKKQVSVKLKDGTTIKLCGACADSQPAKRRASSAKVAETNLAETVKKQNPKSNPEATEPACKKKEPRAKKDASTKAEPKSKQTTGSKKNQTKDGTTVKRQRANPPRSGEAAKPTRAPRKPKENDQSKQNPTVKNTSKNNKNKSLKNVEDKENNGDSFQNISMSNVDDLITNMTKEINETIANNEAEPAKPTRKRAGVVATKVKGTTARKACAKSEKPKTSRKCQPKKDDKILPSPDPIRGAHSGGRSSDPNLSDLLGPGTHSTSLEDSGHINSSGCSFSRQETLKIKPDSSPVLDINKTIKKESLDFSNVATRRHHHSRHSKDKSLSKSRPDSEETKASSKSMPKKTEKLKKSAEEEKVDGSAESKPKLTKSEAAEAEKRSKKKHAKKDKEARRRQKKDIQVARALEGISRFFVRSPERHHMNLELDDLTFSSSDDSDLSMCPSSCSCQSSSSSECNCWECMMRPRSSSDDDEDLMAEYTLTETSSESERGGSRCSRRSLVVCGK